MTERPPDPQAGKNYVRAGCGGLFGATVPLSWLMYLGGRSAMPFILASLVCMVLFAFLAVRYGEALWEWLARWW